MYTRYYMHGLVLPVRSITPPLVIMHVFVVLGIDTPSKCNLLAINTCSGVANEWTESVH